MSEEQKIPNPGNSKDIYIFQSRIPGVKIWPEKRYTLSKCRARGSVDQLFGPLNLVMFAPTAAKWKLTFKTFP